LVCEIKPSEISKERVINCSWSTQLVKEVKATDGWLHKFWLWNAEENSRVKPDGFYTILKVINLDKLKADGITGADYHFVSKQSGLDQKRQRKQH
jgi:hypothetical protein